MIHRIPKTKIRGALTLAEIAGKDPVELERLRREGWLLPIAGGAPEGDDDGDDPPKKKSKKDADDDDDDGDDAEIKVKQSEWDKVQADLATLGRTNRQLQKKLDDADDDKAAEDGKFEELYEKAKGTIETLEGKITDLETGGTARSVAAKLGFHNPDRAVGLLDLSEIKNEADAEKALKALSKSDPYLVNGKKKTTGKVGDDDPAPSDKNDTDPAAKSAEDTRTPEQKMSAAYETNDAAGDGGD